MSGVGDKGGWRRGRAGRGGMLVCFCGDGGRGMEGRVAEEV